MGGRLVTKDHVVSFILSLEVVLVEDDDFCSCDELRCFEFSASVTHIGGDSLCACCDRYKVYAEKRSHAEKWRKEKGEGYSFER